MVASYEKTRALLPEHPISIIQRLGVERSSGRILRTDGDPGAKTRGAMYLDVSAVRHPLIVCALAHLLSGAQEEGGNNRGDWVELYMRGMKGAWCAGFVAWHIFAVYGPLIRYIRGAIRLTKAIAKRGEQVWLDNIQVGDVIAWVRPTGRKGTGHVGIVAHVGDDFILTIEGNAGPRGQVRVWRYERADNYKRNGNKVVAIGRFPEEWAL